MSRRREAAVVAVLAIAAVLVGAGHADATLPGDGEVVGAECDDGVIETVHVRLTFRGDAPVEAHAHVWDQKQKTQYAWLPRTITLEPGTETYTLTAPASAAQVTADTPAQVAINVGQQREIINWRAAGCSGEGRR
jgi:hypothetical protein